MPDNSPEDTRPIELVTENGFSILRPWEIDRVAPPVTGKYSFFVRNPHGAEREREIVVEIADDAVLRIEKYSRGRISLCNSFWICCAERHLADYVWENDDYPPDGKLRVEQLTLDDLNLAIRWGTS